MNSFLSATSITGSVLKAIGPEGTMTRFPPTTLQQLDRRIQEHTLEMARLRAALEIQFKRIAQMQAELDGLPQAIRRRRLLLAEPSSLTRNGHLDR